MKTNVKTTSLLKIAVGTKSQRSHLPIHHLRLVYNEKINILYPQCNNVVSCSQTEEYDLAPRFESCIVVVKGTQGVTKADLLSTVGISNVRIGLLFKKTRYLPIANLDSSILQTVLLRSSPRISVTRRETPSLDTAIEMDFQQLYRVLALMRLLFLVLVHLLNLFDNTLGPRGVENEKRD